MNYFAISILGFMAVGVLSGTLYYAKHKILKEKANQGIWKYL